MNSKPNNLFEIERYSSDVQAIMSAPPKWIIRYGLTVFFVIIAVILLSSFFVKYPDVLDTAITVRSVTPPGNLVASEGGRVVFLVKEGQLVKKDQLLGYFDNAIDLNNILPLLKAEDSIRTMIFTGQIGQLQFDEKLPFGDIQDAYGYFLQSIKAYKRYIYRQEFQKNLTFIDKQTSLYNSMRGYADRQVNISSEQQQLARSRLYRDSILFEQHVISAQDWENSKTTYLPFLKTSENSKENVKTNEMQIVTLNQQKFQLQSDYDKNLDILYASVVSSFHDLSKRMLAWKQRYLFLSPIDGYVSMFEFIGNYQYVQPGQLVMSVENAEAFTTIGICLIPMSEVAKVKADQKVNIELSNYPSSEYGFLTGRIKSISKLTKDNFYIAYIQLPDKPVTDVGKQIEYKEGMSGRAKILTRNYRVFDRFIRNFTQSK